jgi:hypothetical protein
MRLVLAASFALLATATLGRDVDAKSLGDCEKKVPAEAERAFEAVSSAFRRGDAKGVTSAMGSSRDARVTLALSGVSGTFAQEQATTLLSSEYFPARKILSLMPADGCTTGDATTLSRTYRMRVQVNGREERDATLTVDIVRRRVDDRTFAWYLGALREF